MPLAATITFYSIKNSLLRVQGPHLPLIMIHEKIFLPNMESVPSLVCNTGDILNAKDIDR